jgi:hypothetical protein
MMLHIHPLLRLQKRIAQGVPADFRVTPSDQLSEVKQEIEYRGVQRSF